MTRFRRLALASTLLLALVVAGALAWFARSLPQTTGRLAVAGLAAPVEIVRDANAVPHIIATSRADAHFALGFAHAQDRLWQMELARRAGAGRLAEILGADALANDEFMRTLGLSRVAAANLESLDAPTRTLLDAYVAGVNAFLSLEPPLPPEFTILRHRPEPWTAGDSLLWPKLIALDLDGNWRRETGRIALSRRLNPRQLAEFLPTYGRDEPRGVRPGGQAALPAILTPRPEGIGSNAWAISGVRAENGKPLLANDPHLGLRTPSLWYLAHLSWPGGTSVGATIPGFPALVLGHNGRIAWTMTNTGTDVQDLFLETTMAGEPGRYLTPEGPRAFAVRRETIGLRGGAAVEIKVRESRHGPLLSDLFDARKFLGIEDRALALAWTALEPGDHTLKAAFALAQAGNWREFNTALADYRAPQQSFLYADVAGNIGFLTPGRTPVRGYGDDDRGLWPNRGEVEEQDWRGYVPFGELPRELNPGDGILITANQKIVADDYPHHLSHEWSSGLRARRIGELLSVSRRLGPDDVADMQSDTLSPLARALLPHLRLAARGSGDIARLLDAWDGRMAADRPEPLIFATWYQALTRLVYADELGPLFPGFWRDRPRFMLSVMTGDKGHWCDDVGTAQAEDCAAMARRAFEAARATLVARHGLSARNWRWGRVREARHGHRPFSDIWFLGNVFDVRAPASGDGQAINAQRHGLRDGAGRFTVRRGPSFRAIYDLSNLARSRFILPTGQSGHPMSPHYRDMGAIWSRGGYITIPTDPGEFDRAPSAKLVLAPHGAP